MGMSRFELEPAGISLRDPLLKHKHLRYVSHIQELIIAAKQLIAPLTGASHMLGYVLWACPSSQVILHPLGLSIRERVSLNNLLLLEAYLGPFICLLFRFFSLFRFIMAEIVFILFFFFLPIS